MGGVGARVKAASKQYEKERGRETVRQGARERAQDREKDSEFEWNDQESSGSVWIDPRVSWCGDRDGDTNSQCTPALHYTGYIVQTVCQY